MPDPSDRNYFVGRGSSGDAAPLPDFPARWTKEPTSPLLPEKEAPASVRASGERFLRDDLPAGTPHPAEVIPVQDPPTLRDFCALPQVGIPIVRDVLDEQNRERARHALTEVEARKAIDEWRGKNPAWCVERIRELEREVKSLQSQIIDVRLGLKGLQ